MVDGFRWKPILRVDQRGSAKEVLCLSPWSQDGWPSFRLAISLYPPSDIYSPFATPLEPHTRIIAFLSHWIARTFISGSGPFSVCMHCLRVPWALDIGAHFFSLSVLITTSLHFISSHCLCYSSHHPILSTVRFTSSSFILKDDHPQFITWRVVMSFPLSILWTLIQGSSVWEGHLIRESLWYIDTWEHVYSFLIPFLSLLCMRSESMYSSFICCKKKRKKK